MKRGTGLPDDDSTRPHPAGSQATVSQGISPLSVAVAFLWLFGFFFWFQSLEIPNNHIPRWQFWESFPYDLLDWIDPPVVAGAAPWSWLFLLQRVPFLWIAICIWTGSWALGSLSLRLLRLPLSGCERFFFSTCLGLSITSLAMLGLGLCGRMTRWPLMAILIGGVLGEIVCCRNSAVASSPTNIERVGSRRGSILGWAIAMIIAPFVIGQLIGSMTPQTDFDVVEYHLGGPKEWFQLGRIGYLPHNIYTSFPFLTEMLLLSGMVLYGDWQWGALAGQATIAGFQWLTAIGLYAAGRRWFSPLTGSLAALVYLTSPWTYRISIIAYAEGGLSCYLFASLFAALLNLDREDDDQPSANQSSGVLSALAGLMSGSAMACKYTGLVQAVIPIGLLIFATGLKVRSAGWMPRLVFTALLFMAGVGVAIGPWLLKNQVETGNPVYPLAFRVFGGKDRDQQLDQQFRSGHAAVRFATWNQRANDLARKLQDVAAMNDWHSPLMFGLAPLSILVYRRRRESLLAGRHNTNKSGSVLCAVWYFVAWMFFTWWLFIHPIDRFYVPMFSAVALLAAVGAAWPALTRNGQVPATWVRLWRGSVAAVIVASLIYNAEIMFQSGISGFNAGRLMLTAARDLATGPHLQWLNDQIETGALPAGTKVLFVGEAGLFHARFPYVYNTVFNRSLFEQICVQPNAADHELRSVDEIKALLAERGITHIDVSWSEILRFREPGSYGYTDFVHPDRFAELQRMGVLGPAVVLPIEIAWAGLGPVRQDVLKAWAPQLITEINGKPAYPAVQIFPVMHGSRSTP